MSFSLFDIVPGKRIGDHYTVVRSHRQGGFSTAFELEDERDSSRCEMQLFPTGLFESDGQLAEFHEKLQPWIAIDSEAVLHVREVLDLEGSNLALITDFPIGEALRKRLKRDGKLARDEVISIGRQLLDGLSQMHARELIHGDIKPNTVFVDGAGAEIRAMLLDGGITPGLWLAKDLGDKTALIGTPYYAPIEQFGGDAPDVRSDIYNVATVLFECATGVLPWKATSFLEVFQAKLQDPPPMRERAPEADVDAGLEEAIMKGCQADRNRRYASAEEFREALTALI